MGNIYISETAWDALVTANERKLAWESWGVDNRLCMEIMRECIKLDLSHGQMDERLCGAVRKALSAAKLEAAGMRARESAAEAIVASEEVKVG